MSLNSLKFFLRHFKRSPAYLAISYPRRATVGLRYINRNLPDYLRWLFQSHEETNFTYDIPASNRLYLEFTISVVTGKPLDLVQGYVLEIEEDEQLRTILRNATRESPFRFVSDVEPRYGRRIGWYALARIIKPKVILETGVDKGLGAAILCAALMRNAAEGHQGRYYGTDINHEAGWLLKAPYSDFGEILYGDSIESLRRFDRPIDLFINDSDHSAAYEIQEYETIADKLNKNAVILGDNAHKTSGLAEFAVSRGRRFLFFQERAKNHWYPGAGIGFCF